MINFDKQQRDVNRLGKMIETIVSAGITSTTTKKSKWLDWKKSNENYLNEVFE